MNYDPRIGYLRRRDDELGFNHFGTGTSSEALELRFAIKNKSCAGHQRSMLPLNNMHVMGLRVGINMLLMWSLDGALFEIFSLRYCNKSLFHSW